MVEWQYIDVWDSYRKDNGQQYVLVIRQLFGKLCVQRYRSFESAYCDKEFMTYDEKEAFYVGDKWLGYI